MCGIVGYIGGKEAASILLDGLKRLEYRGYDSAGLALYHDPTAEGEQAGFSIQRAEGKLINLTERVDKQPMRGSFGLGHTRWATHGSPSEMNAHPHWSKRVIVVHNGIIENYRELKEELTAGGSDFTSDTDTEVIPHLIEHYWQQFGDLDRAFREAVGKLVGSYAIGMFAVAERKLYAAKFRSPLILGVGEGENFLASDIPAVLDYTRDIVVLEDGDIAMMTEAGVEVTDLDGNPQTRNKRRVTWTASMAEKGGYRHFMLKEIHEQPAAVIQTLQGRVNQSCSMLTLDELKMSGDFLCGIERIVIVACGTSWHAGLVGKYMLESLAKIPVEIDLASEFRYRGPILNDKTLLVAISQSGETADTLAALDEAKAAKSPVLAICNVLESSIPRTADFTFYTHAGPEIGVASTKAFTTQLVALYLLALYVAECRNQLPAETLREYIDDLIKLPGLMEQCLSKEEEILQLAKDFFQYSDFLYLGRGLSFPIALEGALKLKEISYIHAEGYPAGEIKHGPIALIDDKMPVLVIAASDATYEKTLANLSEVKTREGITILCIAESQQEEAEKLSVVDHLIITPDANRFLLPILQAVPLQLLAYHIAVLRGTDVDQPRNLAKSVTVE